MAAYAPVAPNTTAESGTFMAMSRLQRFGKMSRGLRKHTLLQNVTVKKGNVFIVWHTIRSDKIVYNHGRDMKRVWDHRLGREILAILVIKITLIFTLWRAFFRSPTTPALSPERA